MAKERNPLLSEDERASGDDESRWSEDEVTTAITYLRLLTPNKTPACTSYWLKNRCEEWCRANGLSGHVSNGALIVAAEYLNLPVQYDPSSPNAMIGVSEQSVQELARSPDG